MRDLSIGTIGGGAFIAKPTDLIEFGPGLKLQGVRMPVERNKEIFGEGEPADYIYRVVAGAVRTMRFSSDGRRQILAFHMPGDIFGLEFGPTHGFSAEAVANSEIVMVRRSLVEKATAQDVGAAQALLHLTSNILRAEREHVHMLGLKGAVERVAAFLLHLADRFNFRLELDLPMSRADIADYLALTIETVSRAFTQMERDQAIELPSSRHVVMCSRAALEQLQAA